MNLDDEELKATKEKTADEMFKELGYRKDAKPIEFAGKRQAHICYRDDMFFKTVHFYIEDKFFTVSCMDKNIKEVLQAINKKCEELGWLKEGDKQ